MPESPTRSLVSKGLSLAARIVFISVVPLEAAIASIVLVRASVDRPSDANTFILRVREPLDHVRHVINNKALASYISELPRPR